MKKLVAILVGIFPCTLLAQQARDSVRIHTLPQVTVIENYHVRDVKSSVPTQTFGREQLQQLNALQLSDAVKHFSGVTVKDYGGIGGLKTISIRSLGAEHTGISYDGVAITDFQTGQIDIGRYSLDNIDHLSLYIGQDGNIFQPARQFASAGTLNISTITPSFKDTEWLHGTATVKTGSWGLINPSLRIEEKMGKHWAFSANGEWMSVDGRYPFTLHYTNSDNDLSSKEKRNNTEVRSFRIETELFGNFGANEQLRLKAYYYNSSRGLPGATTYYYNYSSQHLWDKNFFVQGHYQKELGQKWAFQSSVKWNWSFEHYLDPDYKNSEGKTENHYYQQEYYLSSTLLYRVKNNFSVSVSSDESYNKLNSDLYDFAFPSRFTWLTALAAKYTDNYLTVTGSLLSTITDEHVKSGKAGANYSRLSPFASISLRPFASAGLLVRAFYKDIFRLPTFNDLYYSSIGYTGLKPERTRQINMGLTYNYQGNGIVQMVTASVDAYYNKVDDKIIAIPTKNLFIWSMVNLGKVDMKGIDANTVVSIAIDKRWKVELSANGSYLRAIDKTDSDGKTYNQQIAYTPRISGSGQCSIYTPWATLSYSYLYSGKRYMLGQNISANRLNSYSDSSISARRTFDLWHTQWTVGAELLNLMNKNYEIVKNFPMPGRSFRINLKVQI